MKKEVKLSFIIGTILTMSMLILILSYQGHVKTKKINEVRQAVTFINEDNVSDLIDRNHYFDYKDTGNNPFKLVTQYKDQIIVDFGSEKSIDSLKCLRYQEIMKREEILERLNKPCQ